MKYPFTVRVYGLLTNAGRILVCDEYYRNRPITKFPGGGMQFGEGTADCLKREFREELGLAIRNLRHFYTTDFFQPSAFDPGVQVVSIYYCVEPAGPMKFSTREKPFDSGLQNHKAQSFRWIDMAGLTEDLFTFPIDRKVAGLLIQGRARERIPE